MPFARPVRSRSAALGILLVLGAGCATPIGVDRTDRLEVQRQLAVNAISAGVPSVTTTQVLRRTGLVAVWESDRDEALRRLHALLAGGRPMRRLYALAELSYLRGIETGDRGRHLAAAVYASALLFPPQGAEAPSAPWDPRSRAVFDLYNRAVAEAFSEPGSDELRFEPGRYALPFGTLDIEVGPPPTWAGYQLAHFVDTADFEVRGLANRYRVPGVGVSLAASLETVPGSAVPPFHHRIPPTRRLAANAFLRLDDPGAQITTGESVALRGRIELYDRESTREVTERGRTVPLEYDNTAPLAYGLEGAAIWDFELSGFFSASVQPLARALRGEAMTGGRSDDGLYLMHVHRPGRVPLVLVHGTASSPARWADLANEIENDPVLGDRVELWLFIYNTGNPVLLSALRLREAITNAVNEIDPGGSDPGLREIVVMGHSQGGLLTKLTAVESGDRFWTGVSKVPLAEIKTDDATRDLLGRAMFVKPVPNVRRVIFMSTPHRGSYLAALSPARWISGLIQLPVGITQSLGAVMTQNEGALTVGSLGRLPTSIDNMTPGNPFLEALIQVPVVPGVHAHSIIPVKGDGPLEDEDDGVVKYTSAHLDDVESEKVVRHSGHSTQSNPETIEEVRRILRLHVARREAAPEAEASKPRAAASGARRKED
jgi:pimeloyl-ACP methyl ester carboxylesterase